MAKKPVKKTPIDVTALFKARAKDPDNKIIKEQLKALVTKSAAPTVLDHSFIGPMHLLQGMVVADLKERKKGYWLRERDEGSLSDHLNSDMKIVGLLYGEQLLAMALLTQADNPAAINLEGYPIDDAEKTIVVQSYIVHPGLRGIGAGRKLMDLIQHEASAAGRPILMARVATDNEDSISSFMGAEFFTVGQAQEYESAKSPTGHYKAIHWEKIVEIADYDVRPAQLLRRSMQRSLPSTPGAPR